MRKSLMVLSFLMISKFSFSQDTSTKELHVSGNIGVTNNGISIIPTFSLKQSAFNLNYFLSRGGRFSIDPDIRLTFDGKKGSGIVWFRYKLKTEGKFKVNIGVHPAYNFAIRTITEEGKPLKITQARRYVATEFAPSYKVNEHLNFGVYYLRGKGMQEDGPQNVHFLNFITGISKIPLFSGYSFNITPQLYYLESDKQDGYYFNSNVVLAKQKSPLVLVYMVNKEIRSNVAGSVNFDWNISLLYNFSNKFKSFK
jgi:hypothetical protein